MRSPFPLNTKVEAFELCKRRRMKMVYLFVVLFLSSLAQYCEALTQSFLPAAQPTTVPALPEQSDAQGCALELTEELFKGIGDACGGKSPDRAQCCPVLAASLYAAYARTALGAAVSVRQPESVYDMPILPGDSEMCVDNLQRALKARGIEVREPNATCDAYFCYCGIRLHRLSPSLGCPDAFAYSVDGKLVAAPATLKLEKDCAGSGFAGCSKCLGSLYKLSGNGSATTAKAKEERKGRMQSRECEMMGLTWLLAKNKTAYLPTVASVLRAFMTTDAGDPQSCNVNRNNLPLAVDSAELGASDACRPPRFPAYAFLAWLLSCHILLPWHLVCVLFLPFGRGNGAVVVDIPRL